MSSYLVKDQLHLTYEIGVGLESMTINSMRWDGTVNPRVEQNCLLPMAVASRDGVTRLEQDQAAVDLHKKASAAAAAAALGRFKDEIVHVHTKMWQILGTKALI
ncbi:3-ketoacyl-CoA thiolase 2, peroxisomal-like isoform X2 [Daucus carota subsp. sativus]|uniref:3-ketoacyl-CoA thiolase 2, peroxisomal-like isoform X2 n=1 Tax=Daucus carota subsp. sativus TaxID=79200 RepID=UPI003083105D